MATASSRSSLGAGVTRWMSLQNCGGRRKTYFDETASPPQLHEYSDRKDFWCAVPEVLFELRDIPELRFKGGTSL